MKENSVEQTKLYNPSEALELLLSIPLSEIDQWENFDIYNPETNIKHFSVTISSDGNLSIYDYVSDFLFSDPNYNKMFSGNIPAVSVQFARDFVSNKLDLIAKQ